MELNKCKDIPVTLEGFASRGIFVRPRGIFSFGPKIFSNGRPVLRTGHDFLIPNDNGDNVGFRLRYRFLDPVPDLIVANRRIILLPPLKPHKHLWICLSLFLVLYGGLLGGVCSVCAIHTNFTIFRSNCSPAIKYSLSGLITVSAVLLYFAAVFVLAHGLRVTRGS